jgi:hypothetical protein
MKVYNDPSVKNLPFFALFMFHKPVLFITEPELVKRIMVKDFQHFQNRHTTSYHKTDPIGDYNLLIQISTVGQLRDVWRPERCSTSATRLTGIPLNTSIPEIELKALTACLRYDGYHCVFCFWR